MSLGEWIGGLKQRWLFLPRKFKILLLGGLIILSFGAGVLAFIAGKDLIDTGQIQLTNEEQQLNEGWTKLLLPERPPPYFTLSSVTQKRFGILPSETFVLTAKEPVDVGTVEQNLKSSHPVSVSQTGEKEFKIVPSSPLALDQQLTMSIDYPDRNYSWAFQTQGKFRIKSTIPGDKTTRVPVNTGVEILFSQDDYEDPTKFISISPEIKFRTERHGDSFSIIPLSPLKYSTAYTVTVKSGIGPESRKDTIDEDYSFSFQTQQQESAGAEGRNKWFMPEDRYIQSVTNEAPGVSVYTYGWPDDLKVKGKLYQFTSGDQFVEFRRKADTVRKSWYSFDTPDQDIDPSGLGLIATMDLAIQKQEEVRFIKLPEALSAGFYLLELSSDTQKHYLWIQSTDVSGYVAAGRKQTLVWTNNAADSQAVANANVSVFGSGQSFYTSDQGITVFGTPSDLFSEKRSYLDIKTEDGKRLILPVDSRGEDGNENSSDYWTYLYHERYMYLPGDNLHFWGVAKKRGGAVPQSLQVAITGDQYLPGGRGSKKVYSEITVIPDADGTFSGLFPLNLSESYYSLEVKSGDLALVSSYFNVRQYTKPEIKIEVTGDKKAIFAGEKVQFTAKTSFYDETPIKQIGLRVTESGKGTKSELKTDNYGEVKYAYQPEYTKPGYYPQRETVVFNPLISEQATVEGVGSVRVFGSHVAVNSDREQSGANAKLAGKVNQVDLTGINDGTSTSWLGDPIANHPVKLKVVKEWYEKVQEGTYYDFIEKVTRPAYRYNHKEETVAEQTLTTNGQGELSYEFVMEKERSYRAILTTSDAEGREVSSQEYFYYHSSGGSVDAGENYASLSIEGETNEFSLGQAVDLKITSGRGGNFSDTDKNRFLFVLAQNGNLDFFVEDDPTLSFTFEQKHIPNVSAGGVVFTGSSYQVANPRCEWSWQCDYSFYYERNYFSPLNLAYKKADSEIDLTITADKDKYAPGEKAKITVKSLKNNQPLANVHINLALVDQALAALGAVQEPDILPDLYQKVPADVFFNFSSHRPILPKPPGAERGGGGGGDYRDVFKDTPFFGATTTNADGEAVFEFNLPDNITTWVVYAQGVDGNLSAGQTESAVISTKDFFVTANFPRELLTRDEGVASANGFGRVVSPGQNVAYESVVYKGDEVIDKKSSNGEAGKDVVFEIPALQAGVYDLGVSGKTGSLTDGVLYPLNVKLSRLTLDLDKKFEIQAGGQVVNPELSGMDGSTPINLVVTDVGKGQYYSIVKSYCYTSSNRLEKNVARTFASNLLFTHFDQESCRPENEELSPFQTLDGGLSQVVWGGSVLESTVWAVYVDQTPYDRELMKNYFKQKLERKQEGNLDKIYAAWGLNLLGESHVNDLKFLVINSGTYTEKAVGAIALASAGETEMAREIYYDLLSEYGYEYKPYIRIQRGNLQKNVPLIDQYITDSSQALLLGRLVESDYNRGLGAYVRDYRSEIEDILIDLSLISFVDWELRQLPAENTQVLISKPSGEQEVSLQKANSYRLALSSSDLSSFTAKANSGKAELRFVYNAAPEKINTLSTDNRLKLSRAYKNETNPGQPITTGDIVSVSLNFDLTSDTSPKGGYVIRDFLPSGLVYLSNPGLYGKKAEGWIRQTENANEMRGGFYNSPWWHRYGQKFITYFARAAAPGTYIAEPALLQSTLELSVVQKTDESTLTIEPR